MSRGVLEVDRQNKKKIHESSTLIYPLIEFENKKRGKNFTNVNCCHMKKKLIDSKWNK